jgi:membrane protein
MSGLFGEQGGKVVEEVAASAAKPAAGVISSIIGGIMLLVGAIGVFGELHDTLNKMWEVNIKKGFWQQIKVRFFSFTMVLGVGFLLLVSLILSAVLAAAGKYIGGILPFSEILMQIIEFIISFTIIVGLFTLLFKYIPQTDVPWKPAVIGAAFTALFFVMGKLLLGVYLGKATVISSYGAAGSLIAVLVWVFYSAQIFFLGAEFTQVYAKH